MRDIQVRFESPEDIAAFVSILERFPSDMDLNSGRYVVDAKSMLGIMNIGLKKVTKLTVRAEEYDAVKNAIKKYVYE